MELDELESQNISSNSDHEYLDEFDLLCWITESQIWMKTHKILQTLENGTEEEFLQEYNSLEIHTCNAFQIEFLNKAIKRNEFNKAFDAILSNVIDINELNEKGETLLEHAIWHKNDKAVEKLLKAGAYIGTANDNNEFTIDRLGPQVLEELLNSCVTSNNYKLNEQDYEIRFTYENLQPTDEIRRSRKNFDEMTPIMRILNSKSFIHLLKHPLISSFMTLRWRRIAMLFYINFILYCFYMVSMVSYVIFKCEKYPSTHPMVILTFWLTTFGIAYIILREMLQFLTPKTYLSTPSNWVEVPLIYLSIKTITTNFADEDKPYVVLMILLIAMEFCILVGSLPILSISTHMLMLQEVLKSFLKSFALYSIFVFTFGLSFYVLLRTASDTMFSNVLTSFVKVMAMFVGELDLSSLNPQSVYTYLLFLLFVIFMTVVLFNLLNGLAVSDTHVIRQQAELNELICRAKLLIAYEHYSLPKFMTKRNDEMFNVLKKCSCSRHSICILPNNCVTPNKILPRGGCEICCCPDDDDAMCSYRKSLQLICDWWFRKGTTVMPSEIVKVAAEIIAQQKLENKENNQIQKIAEKVEDIFEILKKFNFSVESLRP